MRLVNFGAGEITDRLTILSLKILHGGAAGKAVDHFVAERDHLLGMIKGRTLNGIWFEQVLELAAVNASLWQAEDELRAWRTEDPRPNGGAAELTGLREIVALAFRIQTLNDRRAELVSLINANTGEKSGEEKVSV